MSQEQQRIKFLDAARAVAISLSLSAHFMRTFYEQPDFPLVWSLVQRCATPTFFILCGIMLELVYVKKLKDDGSKSIAKRLSIRSFQCYAGYVLVGLSAWIGGHRSYDEFLAFLLFFHPGRFGNILRLYSILLLAAIPLLLLRKRLGAVPLILLLLAVWLPYPWVSTIQLESMGYLAIPSAGLLGIGGKIGPSVMHAFTFVVVGMLLGWGLKSRGANGMCRFYILLTATSVLCAIGITSFVWTTPAWELLANYASGDLRRNNHPLYYLLGTLSALALLSLMSLVIPAKKQTVGPLESCKVLGTSSLIAFTVGNMLVNVVSQPLQFASWFVVALLAVAYLGCIVMLTSVIRDAKVHVQKHFDLSDPRRFFPSRNRTAPGSRVA